MEKQRDAVFSVPKIATLTQGFDARLANRPF